MRNKKANFVTKVWLWFSGSTRMWWSKTDGGKWHHVVVNQRYGKAKQMWIDGVEIGVDYIPNETKHGTVNGVMVV